MEIIIPKYPIVDVVKIDVNIIRTDWNLEKIIFFFENKLFTETYTTGESEVAKYVGSGKIELTLNPIIPPETKPHLFNIQEKLYPGLKPMKKEIIWINAMIQSTQQAKQ